MRNRFTRIVLTGMLALIAGSAAAQDWADYATVSMTNPTTPKLTDRNLCYSDGRDIACNGAAGQFTASGTLAITNISATALTVNGVAISGGGGGASTFASLTDVSYSAVGRNIYGPGSLSGAIAGITDNTALGAAALASNTAGYQNSAFGSRALARNTTGYFNTAFGDAALYSNVSGASNVGVGSQALYSNTGGSNNIGAGYYALYSNTTGTGNVALGTQALFLNSTGNYNTAVGYTALQNNTTASQNTAFGYYALTFNTDGAGNSAFGAQALRGNISGIANTAFGSSTLYKNVYGTGNTAVGSSALSEFNTTGGYNTAVGANAMLNAAKGGNNVGIGANAAYGATNAVVTNTVAIGAYAGQAFTSATNNVLVGYNAGGGITTGSSNTVIGANVSPFSNTGNNQLAIANAIFGDVGLGSTLRAKVGINVTSPTASLEVSGTVSASGVIKAGVSSATCTSALAGAMRYNAGAMQYCDGSAWTAFSAPPSSRPYVWATAASAQLVNQNMSTKITFSTENADTAGAFNGYDFCPTTAGKFLLNAVVDRDNVSNVSWAYLYIFKNGSVVLERRFWAPYDVTYGIAGMVEGNGSDCFSVYFKYTGSDSWIYINAAGTFFQAIQI